MTGKWASMIEMLFVYGVVLALAIWQLVSVRREIRRDKERAGKESRPEASAEPPADRPAK